MFFINGQFLEEEEPCIHIQDRGFLLGDGAFETLRSYRGCVFAFSEHWVRLKKALDYLQIPLIIDQNEALSIVSNLLHKNRLQDKEAAIRITVTRGVSPRGLAPPDPIKPTFLITTHLYGKKEINSSSTATICDIPINEKSPLTRHKTLNYLPNILATQKAKAKGFDEAILLNTQGHVVSASAANLFMFKDQRLYTPRLNDGALPGITRQWIINLAKSNNIPIAESLIKPESLFHADEIFISNSLIEIKPILLIDGEFRKQTIGEKTLFLKKLFEEMTFNYNKNGL